MWGQTLHTNEWMMISFLHLVVYVIIHIRRKDRFGLPKAKKTNYCLINNYLALKYRLIYLIFSPELIKEMNLTVKLTKNLRISEF